MAEAIADHYWLWLLIFPLYFSFLVSALFSALALDRDKEDDQRMKL